MKHLSGGRVIGMRVTLENAVMETTDVALENVNVLEKVVYTKEELAEKVKVPGVVEQDLKRIISDRLEQCGLYYRVFSRTKTADSMARKFELKEYSDDRKLQDLVGVRINLYFDDDVDICINMMERTFELVNWSTSKRNEDEFKPAKLNGVFRLPEYLKDKISPVTWDMQIDDTFEIQIKTMFFEGWHEIEHDMRYKGVELWNDYPGFSRYFNSILATLELCDKSMVSLFEDLGHELYKTGHWSDMIRSHYRLKMDDTPIYPELSRLLDEDQQANVDSIAKRVYKTPKSVLVDLLLRRVRKIPINVNTIIALLNDNIFHDMRLTELFRARDVYNDGREESYATSSHYSLKPLQRHDVFRMHTWVDGSRIRDEENPDTQLIFTRSAFCIQKWILQKYGALFPDMPEEPCTFERDDLAYHISMFYQPDKGKLYMFTRHPDLEVGGRTWYSLAALETDETGRVLLRVCNGYAEPQHEHFQQESAAMLFSYPGYYKMIVDNVGVNNGIECSNRRRILREDQLGAVRRALTDPQRLFPIVLIISLETEDGQMDEGWLGQFRVSDFTRTVWRYTHVFTCYEKTGRKLLENLRETPGGRTLLGGTDTQLPRMYVFMPDEETVVYGPEDVNSCSFGRHLEARDDARTYDIVHGGQAFYHKIVTDLREWNVSSVRMENQAASIEKTIAELQGKNYGRRV